MGKVGDIPPEVAPFWTRFRRSAGLSEDAANAAYYETFHFDDNEQSANELAGLALAGQKRATAGLRWTNDADRKPLPKPGDLSIVTRWSGEPLFVMRTTAVEVVPFEDVPASFAVQEGEGDGSLRGWREAHWRCFKRDCARIGREPSPRMPVVCECFEVIYRETATE